MAAYTQTQSGDFGTDATWGGGGHPVDGDTWSTAATFTLTVTGDETFGTAADATGGTVVANSTLVIADGGILRAKNHITNNGTVTVQAGGELVFATLGGSVNFQLRPGTNGVVNLNGTEENPVIVRSDTTGGGAGRGGIFQGGSTSGHKLLADWVQFTDLGTASVRALYMLGGTNAASHFELRNCVATRCGRFQCGSLAANANLIVEDNDLSGANLDTAGNAAFMFTCTEGGSGTRSIQRNIFAIAKNVAWVTSGKGGMTFKHNMFGGFSTSTPGSVVPFAEFSDNFHWIQRGSSAAVMAGCTVGDTPSRLYSFGDFTGDFGSYLGEAITTTGGTITFDRFIFDSTAPTSDMQVLATPEPTAGARTYILQNSLVLQGPGTNHSAGGTFTAHGNALTEVLLSHNTVYTGGTSANSVAATGWGSGYTGHPGWYDELRDNLFWAESAPSTYGRIIWLNRSQTAGEMHSGAAAVGSTETQTDTAAVSPSNYLTTAQYRLGQDAAAVIYYTSGVNAGLARAVLTTVDANSLTHDAFPSAPGAGDTFRVGIVDLIRPEGNLNNALWNVLTANSWEVGGVNAAASAYSGLWVTDIDQLGASDVALTAAPGFVDRTRNLMTFASAYLGRNATNGGSYGSSGQGVWSNGHGTYNVGDVVSHTAAGFFGGATCLYRCILAHDPTGVANDEPGNVGSAWRAYWEPASCYELRLDLATRIPQLIDWVFGGLACTNTQLYAASDNVSPSNGWIGAVEGIAPASLPSRSGNHGPSLGIGLGLGV